MSAYSDEAWARLQWSRATWRAATISAQMMMRKIRLCHDTDPLFDQMDALNLDEWVYLFSPSIYDKSVISYQLWNKLSQCNPRIAIQHLSFGRDKRSKTEYTCWEWDSKSNTDRLILTCSERHLLSCLFEKGQITERSSKLHIKQWSRIISVW